MKDNPIPLRISHISPNNPPRSWPPLFQGNLRPDEPVIMDDQQSSSRLCICGCGIAGAAGAVRYLSENSRRRKRGRLQRHLWGNLRSSIDNDSRIPGTIGKTLPGRACPARSARATPGEPGISIIELRPDLVPQPRQHLGELPRGTRSLDPHQRRLLEPFV